MPSWSTRVTESPALNSLRQAKSVLSNLDLTQLEAEEKAGIERIAFIVEHIEAHLITVDPRLVRDDSLNTLNSNAHSLVEDLQNYQQNKDPSHLSRANQFLDQLLAAENSLPVMLWKGNEVAIREMVQSFRDEVTSVSEEMERLSADFKKSLKETIDLLHRNQQDSNSALDSVSSQIEQKCNEFQSKTDDFTNQIQSHVQRLDSAVSNVNDLFSISEKERSQQFTVEQRERSSDFQKVIEDQRVAGKELIDYLQSVKNQAEQILGITAASVTADAYLQDSKEQRREANVWRIVAFCALAAAVTIGYVTLTIFGPPANTSVTEVVYFYATRVPLVLAVVGLAGYAIRESSQHRSRERENKRLANELTTFRPFLAELDEAERNNQVKEASKRYFPGHDNTVA